MLNGETIRLDGALRMPPEQGPSPPPPSRTPSRSLQCPKQ